MAMTDNMRGALLMTGSMTAFTVNDAFMKGLIGSMPLMQAIFLRSLLVIPLMIVIALATRQLRFDLSRRDWKLIALRTTVEMAAAYCFLTALFNMPIANVTAILQALPLTVTLAAAVFFREPLGWRRMSAILVGFTGVLLIVRPGGDDFNVFSLYALVAVMLVTVRDLAARRMSQDVPSILVAVVTACGVSVMAGVGMMFEQTVAVTWIEAQLLCGAALFILFGYVFSVSAMRVGEIGFVAPFRYTGLLVALVIGAVVFDEIPKVLTLLGALIVVAMGLFTLYRERVLRRRLSSGVRP